MALQPDFNLIADSLQIITDHVRIVPNIPAIPDVQNLNIQLQAIHLQLQNLPSLQQIQTIHIQLQSFPTFQQINELLNPIRVDIAAIRAEQRHMAMRFFNCSLRPEGNLRYPPGVAPAQGNGLPTTYLQLLNLTGNLGVDCQLASNTLGIPPLPNGITVSQKRAQLAEFLGVPYVV